MGSCRSGRAPARAQCFCKPLYAIVLTHDSQTASAQPLVRHPARRRRAEPLERLRERRTLCFAHRQRRELVPDYDQCLPDYSGAPVSKASAGDTIIIAAGTYTESIDIGKDLTLIGFGADATIIDQGQIYVSGATVNIYDLAMTRGNGGAGGDGGALYNDSGSVTLGYAAILSSHAYYGGGLVNYHGSLIVDHTILRNNGAIRDGGGMLNDNGQLTISHSTIISNTACNTSCPFAANGSYRRQKPEYGFLSLGGGINIYLGSHEH